MLALFGMACSAVGCVVAVVPCVLLIVGLVLASKEEVGVAP